MYFIIIPQAQLATCRTLTYGNLINIIINLIFSTLADVMQKNNN